MLFVKIIIIILSPKGGYHQDNEYLNLFLIFYGNLQIIRFLPAI